MKNLFYSLCLLIGFSSWTTPINHQVISLNFNDIEENITKTTDCQLDIFFKICEENLIDEAFDLDIKNYLPENFNAYAGLFDAFDNANEEADEPFDFDTTTYLPVGFNATIQFEEEIYEAFSIGDYVQYVEESSPGDRCFFMKDAKKLGIEIDCKADEIFPQFEDIDKDDLESLKDELENSILKSLRKHKSIVVGRDLGTYVTDIPESYVTVINRAVELAKNAG